jgi:hypothetical protein
VKRHANIPEKDFQILHEWPATMADSKPHRTWEERYRSPTVPPPASLPTVPRPNQRYPFPRLQHARARHL